MKISTSQTPSSAGGYIPEQIYRGRCLGVVYGKSSSGNQMTTLSCEIIEPEKVMINNKEVNVAGRKFSLYLVHNVNKTGWGTQEQVMQTCGRLKVELGTDENGEPEYDTDLCKEYFHGLEFDIILRAKEDIKVYSSGPEKGKPILDGEGKQISSGWRIQANLDDILEHCNPHKNEEIAAQPL